MRVEPNTPYLEHLSADAQSRAESGLRRNRDGAMTDLVTPLINRSEIPDEGRVRLRDELIAQVLPTGYSWLDEAEFDQSERLGAYSIQLPWVERKDDVHGYFKKYSHDTDPATLEMAKLITIEQLGLSNLRPITTKEAFEQMPEGTNLGFPFLTSDKRKRKDVLALALDIEANGYQGWNVIHDPAFLYWRGQPRGIGEVPKQRVVDGYPHWLTILETKLVSVLIENLKGNPEFASWVNQDRVNAMATYLLDSAVQPILSVDFSGFDSHLPGEVIDAAWDIVRKVFRYEYWPLIDLCEERFRNIGLMTPEGILLGRSGAVPSGSTFTNWIDTVSHKIMWNYVSLVMRNRLVGAMFQGDDGVISFHDDWNIIEVKELFRLHFGMVMNADKGGVSEERIYFLQNIHSLDYKRQGICVNVRPIMRALNGMMSYERMTSKDWNGYMDTLRWWQQCENCKYHPQFLKLAEFLYRHDKYSRTMSAANILQQGGGWRRVESILKQPSFPFGKESLRGLYNFTIVRALDALQQQEASAKKSHSVTQGV